MSTAEYYTLVEHQKSYLKNYAYKLTRNTEDANDLLQDTFLKAVHYKDKFMDATNLKAWLSIIMKNTFINQYRRAKKKQEVDQYVVNSMKETIRMSIHDTSPYSKMLYNELKVLIQTLKREFKEPLELFVEGYKYNEIADRLELPLGTVKSRIFLARKELLKILASKGYDTSLLGE
jgi:RNA polymerase sigma-70 factor (ECF subfamily)